MDFLNNSPCFLSSAGVQRDTQNYLHYFPETLCCLALQSWASPGPHLMLIRAMSLIEQLTVQRQEVTVCLCTVLSLQLFTNQKIHIRLMKRPLAWIRDFLHISLYSFTTRNEKVTALQYQGEITATVLPVAKTGASIWPEPDHCCSWKT